MVYRQNKEMLAFKWILRLAQWPMPIVLVLVRLRKDDHEFKDSLNCIIRVCIQKKRPSLPIIHLTEDQGIADPRSFFFKHMVINTDAHS